MLIKKPKTNSSPLTTALLLTFCLCALTSVCFSQSTEKKEELPIQSASQTKQIKTEKKKPNKNADVYDKECLKDHKLGYEACKRQGYKCNPDYKRECKRIPPGILKVAGINVPMPTNEEMSWPSYHYFEREIGKKDLPKGCYGGTLFHLTDSKLVGFMYRSSDSEKKFLFELYRENGEKILKRIYKRQEDDTFYVHPRIIKNYILYRISGDTIPNDIIEITDYKNHVLHKEYVSGEDSEYDIASDPHDDFILINDTINGVGRIRMFENGKFRLIHKENTKSIGTVIFSENGDYFIATSAENKMYSFSKNGDVLWKLILNKLVTISGEQFFPNICYTPKNKYLVIMYSLPGDKVDKEFYKENKVINARTGEVIKRPPENIYCGEGGYPEE